MTFFSILDKSMQRGYRPDLQLDQVTATQAKKSCCWNNKELDRELNASKKALNTLQANRGVGATHIEIKSIFLNVSGRMRYYQKLSSGFWAWLRGIFRCRATNRQLKELATTLSSIQKVVINSESFKYSVLNQIKSGTAKQDLFKQLQKEFPELVISKKPQARDFGLSATQATPKVPFLLHRTKKNIEVALPPATHQAAPTILIASNVKELPNLFASEIEKRFNAFRDKYSSLPCELHFNPAKGEKPPVDKISLFVLKKCCEGKCTLVAEVEHVLHGPKRFEYELSIDTDPAAAKAWIDGIVEENRREMLRIEGLLAQDNLFRVDWTNRTFRADFGVGGYGMTVHETVVSDNLSTEAFTLAKARKDNIVPNIDFFTALPSQGGQKALQLQGGVTAVVEEEGWRSFKVTLNLLPPQTPISKSIPSDQKLEDAFKELLNKECPFWKAANKLNLGFKSLTELEELIKQKGNDLKDDATRRATLKALTNEAAWEWRERGLNKCIKTSYWNPQTCLIKFKELLITESTSEADFKQFIADLAAKIKKQQPPSVSQPYLPFFANAQIEQQYDTQSGETVCFWKATLTHKNGTIDVITNSGLTTTSYDQLLQKIQLVEDNMKYVKNLNIAFGGKYRCIICDEGIICISNVAGGFKIWVDDLNGNIARLGTYKRFEKIQDIISSIRANFSKIIENNQTIEKMREALKGDYQLEYRNKKVVDDLPLACISLATPSGKHKLIKKALIELTPDEIRKEIYKFVPEPFFACAEHICKASDIELMGSSAIHFKAQQALKVALSVITENGQRYYQIQYYDLETRKVDSQKFLIQPVEDAASNSQLRAKLERIVQGNRKYIETIRNNLKDRGFINPENVDIKSGPSSALEFSVTFKGNEMFRFESKSIGHDLACQTAAAELLKRIGANYEYYQNLSNDIVQKNIDFGQVKYKVTHVLATTAKPSHYHIEKYVNGVSGGTLDLNDRADKSLEEFIEENKSSHDSL